MKLKTGSQLNCRLNQSEIQSLANEYVTQNGDDSKALSAGECIRNGDYSRESLMKIVEWKLERENGTYFPCIEHIKENTGEEIAEALEVAVRAKTPRVAIGVLTALNGVGVPVASAIMMAIYPETYTVIDVRSSEELGCRMNQPTISEYLVYLERFKQIAAECGVTLRKLDRALWQKNQN